MVHSGSWFGLPDFGLTELFTKNRTSQGGSDLLMNKKQPSDYVPTQTSPSPAYGPFPSQGSVSSGSSVSGGSSGGSDVMSADVLEATPSGPSNRDIDAIVNPALDSLSSFEQGLQPQLDETIGGLERTGATTVSGLRGEEQRRLDEFGGQRTREQGRTRGAIAEARRNASELLQGLQARFGGTTGTGGFVGELTGAQATRNIAQNRAALQNTLGQITSAENNLKTTVTQQVREVNTNTQNLIAEARNGFQKQLADIAIKRGELQSKKAELRLQAAQNYRNLVADINARNASFKQTIAMNAQAAAQKLISAKAKVNNSYQAQLKASDISKLVSSGAISPTQAQGLLSQQGYLGSAGGFDDEYGVGASPTPTYNELGF